MKQVPIEFLQMVESDINIINENLTMEFPNESIFKMLHKEIDGKYQACIKDWGISMYGWNVQFGFSYRYLDVESLMHNLETMKAKLTAFKYQVNAIPNMMPPNTNVTVKVDNTINVQITFESIRTQIADNTSLTEDQSQEAQNKIDEIEKLVKSSGNKKTKWEKAKPILLWLADKSVDVGAALLPLLLKI